MEIKVLHLYNRKNSPDTSTYKVIGLGSYIESSTKSTKSCVIYSNIKTGVIFVRTVIEFMEIMEENYEVPPSPTFNMTLKERIEHVGGSINENDTVRFGSIMAVDAFIKQNLRDCNLAVPYESDKNNSLKNHRYEQKKDE